MRPSHVALLAAAAAAATAAPASAKNAPITGKLAKNGYTVIALGYDGSSGAATIKGGEFRVAAPAKRVTLSLRDTKGVYAGPVVVGRKGTKAVLGIRAGASLGKLTLAHGAAKTAHALKAKWI